MTPLQLLAGAQVTGPVGSPEVDPLTDWDALAGALVGECTLDAVSMRAAVLLDLREASQLHLASTGLLVLRHVEVLGWIDGTGGTSHHAWTVLGSLPTHEDGRFNLRLYLSPQARLTMSARNAVFVAGDVPGLNGGTASMHSEFVVTQLTSYEAVEPE